MTKKHAWLTNRALTKLTGVRAVCMDCGEARMGSLRGGVCPGVRPESARRGNYAAIKAGNANSAKKRGK